MQGGTDDKLYESDWWLERAHTENQPAAGDTRKPIERDRDRICHSRAFRRLAGKTQVIGTPWADDYRNRLTHTIEVAQVGRTLARKHGVNEALVEAACLAHDIGHPPFGHAGERRLNALMEDYGGFDANAQTLRVLRKLEVKDAGQHGLNLTRATYWSILKYPYRRLGDASGADISGDPDLIRQQDGAVRAEHKFLYDVDLDDKVGDGRTFAEWLGDDKIAAAAAPASRVLAGPQQILACRLMDWADDVAYAIHDFEDAVLARFITKGAIKRVHKPLLDAVRAATPTSAYPDDDPALEDAFSGFEREIDGVLDDVQEAIDPEAALRPKTRRWFGELIDVVNLVEPGAPNPTTIGYRLDIRRDQLVLVALLSRLGYELLIRDERIVRYLRKGTMMLERSFEELMNDPKVVDDRVGQLLPRHISKHLAGMSEADRARAVCDFLASMSEPGLARFYSTLFESDGGSPFH